MCHKGTSCFLRLLPCRTKYWRAISGWDTSRCNLARVVSTGGVCLQITTVPRSVRVCLSELARVYVSAPRIATCIGLFSRLRSPLAGSNPTTVPPRNFLHTTSTVRSNFRDTYNWFPDTAVPRENEGARDVQITGRKRDKLCARAPRACG